jgi:nucleotide-binding universal stress UspA family protein
MTDAAAFGAVLVGAAETSSVSHIPTAQIVVGVDGSSGSRQALRWALAEARLRGLALRIIHCSAAPYVGPRGPAWPMVGYVAGLIEGRAARALSESLTDIIDPALAHGVVFSSEVEPAPAAVGLVEASAEAELLVIGAGGTGHHFGGLGSVAQACCRHARCTVVIVPSPERLTE